MRQRTRVNQGVGEASTFAAAPATFILIALNVIVYLSEIGSGSGGLFTEVRGRLSLDFGLFGPFVADGEWYRIVTYGFLHASLLHVGFNMFALYFLGRLLEPAVGTSRFLGIYFVSLLGGAFGALLLDPNALTVGASGAVFGIFAATFVIARRRGLDALASSIGILILLNLFISVGSARISLGGHLGGLAAGLASSLLIVAGERGMLGRNSLPAELVAMVAIGVIAFAGALAVA
jgi:membrane associated rhomboid family serine protease